MPYAESHLERGESIQRMRFPIRRSTQPATSFMILLIVVSTSCATYSNCATLKTASRAVGLSVARTVFLPSSSMVIRQRSAEETPIFSSRNLEHLSAAARKHPKIG